MSTNPLPPNPVATGDTDEMRLQNLLNRLPASAQRATAWLREPQRRLVRCLAALALLLGGVLSFLPVLGLWMLPLGLVLLADDVGILRRWRGRALAWLAAKRPHWFAPETSTR